jgi:hypothetical protein
MELVPNAGKLWWRSSASWAAIAAAAMDVTIKVVEFMNNNRELRWQDAIVPVVVLLVPLFRVIQQESVTRVEKGESV